MREPILRYLDSDLSLECLEEILDFSRDFDRAGDYPKLAPREPSRNSDIKLKLDEFAESNFNKRLPESFDRTAFLAGLYLVEDFLEHSHRLSQKVQGKGKHRAGDYWHAIMHRREPDDSNSKYWFRRVGDHPVFAQLKHVLENSFANTDDAEIETELRNLISGGEWDPLLFVDFCSRARESHGDKMVLVAEYIQWVEMLLLLKQTYLDASLVQ